MIQATTNSGNSAGATNQENSSVRVGDTYRFLKLDSKLPRATLGMSAPTTITDIFQLSFDLGQCFPRIEIGPWFNIFDKFNIANILDIKVPEYSADFLDMTKKLSGYVEKESLPQVLTGVKILTWGSQGVEFFPDIARWAKI